MARTHRFIRDFSLWFGAMIGSLSNKLERIARKMTKNDFY